MLNTSFSNKTQLKIKIKIKINFFNLVGQFQCWTGPSPAGTVESVSTVHCSREQWRHSPPFT
jgi:hypothetical protein